MDNLIVEDGSIVAGADAYVSLEYAATYHANRGSAVWATLTSDQQKVYIRQATQFLDGEYRNRLKGQRIHPLQPRQFPRIGIVLDASSFASEQFDVSSFAGYVPSNIVPEPIKYATCELAERAASKHLAPDLARGGMIQSQKVDVIETTYFAGAPAKTVYAFVDMILGDYLHGGNTSELVRC